MIISTKGRYALRVMLDLAQHPTDGFIPLQEIAQRQNISREYLTSILKVLVQAGLLDSLRGKGGGYRLNRPPEKYAVGMLLRLVEGDLAPVACVAEDGHCTGPARCRLYAMWDNLDHLINDYLDGITLADFLGDEVPEKLKPYCR